jgi:DNA-binding MarR family transcriptional regulator
MGVMRLARRLRQEREPGDLTLTQLAVLGTLECNGPSSLRRLAEDERVSAPTMSRIVNHLCEAGLVTRAADEADGRQVLIEVTPAACAMLDAVRLRRDLWLAERMRELDDDQRRALRAALPVIELLARR